MKKIILAAVLAGIVCVTSGAIANTSKKKAKADVSQSSEAKQQSFSGLVKQSGGTVFLETAEGVFPLEGKGLKQLVGKKVSILGTIAAKGDAEHIIVAKAVETK